MQRSAPISCLVVQEVVHQPTRILRTDSQGLHCPYSWLTGWKWGPGGQRIRQAGEKHSCSLDTLREKGVSLYAGGGTWAKDLQHPHL